MANTVNTIDTITLTDDSLTLGPLYTTVTGGAGSGGIYSVSGTTGTSYNWGVGANGSASIDWSNISINNSISSVSNSGQLDLHGENADIKVNGRSLMDAITALEERLNILVPNPELEKEWDELRELGERYRELEKKCKEKGEMWKKLKSMPPPTTE